MTSQTVVLYLLLGVGAILLFLAILGWRKYRRFEPGLRAKRQRADPATARADAHAIWGSRELQRASA